MYHIRHSVTGMYLRAGYLPGYTGYYLTLHSDRAELYPSSEAAEAARAQYLAGNPYEWTICPQYPFGEAHEREYREWAYAQGGQPYS